MNASAKYVGIDVSREQLDVAVHPIGERWEVDNDEVGIVELIERLCDLNPTLIVLEATGGWKRQRRSLGDLVTKSVTCVKPKA
jgi:transposase